MYAIRSYYEFGWLAEVTASLELYLGYDIVPELAGRNGAMYGQRANHLFAAADIVDTVLPRGVV